MWQYICPVLGVKNTIADMKCLDEINELTVKYSNHTVIVLGDLNASLTRKQKTARNKLFSASIMEIGLCVPRNYPQCDTFFHHNDKASSQIDYILAFNDCHFLTDIKNFDMSPSNLSSHVPITSTANLLCILQEVWNTAEYGDVITNRVNWQKCDIVKYHIFLVISLSL